MEDIIETNEEAPKTGGKRKRYKPKSGAIRYEGGREMREVVCRIDPDLYEELKKIADFFTEIEQKKATTSRAAAAVLTAYIRPHSYKVGKAAEDLKRTNRRKPTSYYLGDKVQSAGGMETLTDEEVEYLRLKKRGQTDVAMSKSCGVSRTSWVRALNFEPLMRSTLNKIRSGIINMKETDKWSPKQG